MIQIALGNHYCRKINQLLTFNNGRRDAEQLFTKTTPNQPHSSILQSLAPFHPHTHLPCIKITDNGGIALLMAVGQCSEIENITRPDRG